jgi:hypothetical protein
MIGFYALQMAVYTVTLYFILNEVNVRMRPPKTEVCRELEGCIHFGTIKPIKKTSEGQSSDIVIEMLPDANVSGYVEAELLAAGMRDNIIKQETELTNELQASLNFLRHEYSVLSQKLLPPAKSSVWSRIKNKLELTARQ